MNDELVKLIANGVFSLAGGTVAAAVINGIMNRPKTMAEAESESADAETKRATAGSTALAATLSLVKGMREEIDRLSVRLEHAESESVAARNRAESAERDVEHLGRSVDAYRRRVEYLTRLLETAGISVEPWREPDGR